MFVIAGALLGLIVLLATLQYKWLGQISGADRDRMTSILNTRASAFAQDVDRELTRAYLLFQLDPVQQDEGPAAGLVVRYDRWLATARFPKMLKDVYLVSPADDTGQAGSLQRFNPSTRFIEPAEWPASMSEIRARLSGIPAGSAGVASGTATASAGATFVMRTAVPTVWASVPALVVPTPMLMVSHFGRGTDPLPSPVRMNAGVRYAVLLLDAEFMKTEMLPALSQQHFQRTGDGFDYQLAVVPTAERGLVYNSVPEFTPAADAPADAKVDLFQVRVKDFEPLAHEVSRFTAITSAMPRMTGQAGRTVIRETIAMPKPGVTIQSSPMVIVQGGSAATFQHRVDALISGGMAAAAGRAVAASPHWRLLVKHPSGSLEQAVNAVRRRNLLVSTSILGILGVSVGFLVLSTRRAQDLARQQLEFVATVSHELRTPLAVIRSAADNLADGVVNDEARVRQYGQLVRHEGIRLTDLVEQILEFAGLQSGQRTMTTRPVAIPVLLRDVAAAAEAIAQPAGIRIELDIADNLPAVAGDEAALRRVFQNLVGNAMKYGAEARWVGVRAALGRGHLEVSVSDRGIGIAAGDQAKIFDPFYRAPDVVAAQIQGAGLGLSLVKRIVEAHGGDVRLESTPGQGSTFTVSLPALEGDVAEGHDGVGQAATQTL
jgi:two-component system sensor histidine kinase SenX3